MGPVPDLELFKGTTDNHLQVHDIRHASSIDLSSSMLLSDISISSIRDGIADIRFDCKSGAVGQETLTLTAHGTDGFADHAVAFTVTVSDNNPPEIDPIENVEMQAGAQKAVRLSGISDGDASAEQPLTLTARSDNQEALPDSRIKIAHAPGSPYASLVLTPTVAAKNVRVTVTVDDGQGSAGTTSTSFSADIYEHFNYPPTVDSLHDLAVKLSAGTTLIPLAGITDGNGGTQSLTIGATSDDANVIADDGLSVDHTAGATEASLAITPRAEGVSIITLTVADDGAGCENGPRQTSRTVEIEVLPDLPDSYVETFDDLSAWSKSGTYAFTVVDSGSFRALKVECTDKSYWDGYGLTFEPHLDLSEYPFVSMEVYSVNDSTLHWMWFYDNAGVRNDNISIKEKAVWAPPGKWTRIVFRFDGFAQMQRKSGEEINARRITRILFNMHDTPFKWPPPPDYSGTYLIRHVRVGSRADLGTPVATIDPIAHLSLFEGAGMQEIMLTGIGAGVGNSAAPSLEVNSDNTARVPQPTAGATDDHGKALLSFTPSPGTGSAEIAVTVTAEGARDTTVRFGVDIVDKAQSPAVTVTVDPTKKYQTIRGFGTFRFPDKPQYIDDYTGNLGASAVRIGLFDNHIEPVNDNNDPYVLNRAALTTSPFDFDYYRKLKARGVETFILSYWSPPAWMKDNFSTTFAFASAVGDCDKTDNKLSYHYYEEFAENVVAVVRMFKEEAGIDLYGIGLQNEPAFHEPYASAILDPEHFVELLKTVGARFEAEGITTRLFMPEQVFSQGLNSMREYIDAVQGDSLANRYTQVIATHGYAKDGIGEGQPDYSKWSEMRQNAQEGPRPKELWMTETYPRAGGWSEAMNLAGAMHGALVHGNVGLWTLWNIEGTLMQSGAPTRSFYAAKHYYRSVRPAWRRIEAESSRDDVLAGAFTSADESAVSLVLVNLGDSSRSIEVHGDGLPAAFHRYLSSEGRFYEAGADMVDGSTLMPPRSILTLSTEKASDPTPVQSQRVKRIPPPAFAVLSSPLSPSVSIEFTLQRPMKDVTVTILNLQGRVVWRHTGGDTPPGMHAIKWNGEDRNGARTGAGAYLVRLTGREPTGTIALSRATTMIRLGR